LFLQKKSAKYFRFFISLFGWTGKLFCSFLSFFFGRQQNRFHVGKKFITQRENKISSFSFLFRLTKKLFYSYCIFILTDKKTVFLFEKDFKFMRKIIKRLHFFSALFRWDRKTHFVVFAFLFRKTKDIFKNINPEYLFVCCERQKNIY